MDPGLERDTIAFARVPVTLAGGVQTLERGLLTLASCALADLAAACVRPRITAARESAVAGDLVAIGCQLLGVSAGLVVVGASLIGI